MGRVYAAMRLTSIESVNPLSIHVTFTAIVPGACPGEAKMCKNVLKWRTFELTGLIIEKRLKTDGYHAAMRLANIESSFLSMRHLPRLSQGRTLQGRLKCALG